MSVGMLRLVNVSFFATIATLRNINPSIHAAPRRGTGEDVDAVLAVRQTRTTTENTNAAGASSGKPLEWTPPIRGSL